MKMTDTECKKSEREKQMSYINAFIWNLEKWYRWTYLQGRNRDTDVENGSADTEEWGGGEVEGGTTWESSTDIYTPVKVTYTPMTYAPETVTYTLVTYTSDIYTSDSDIYTGDIYTGDIYPSESESHPGMSDSLQPHGLCSPWSFPGQNTGVGLHSLLQGIFPTQRSNTGLLHCRRILCQLSHQGSYDV